MSDKSEIAAPTRDDSGEDDLDLIPTHVAHVQAQSDTPNTAEAQASPAPSDKPVPFAVNQEQARHAAGQDLERQAPHVAPKPLPAPGEPGTPPPNKAEKKASAAASEATTPPPRKAPPRGLGMAWMQYHDRKPTEGRIHWAIGAFAAIFVGVLGVQWWLASGPQAQPSVPELDPSRFEGRAGRRQSILQEMEKAAQEAPLWQSPVVPPKADEKIALGPMGAKGAGKKPSQQGKATARPSEVPSPEPEPMDPIRQRYEARYGPARDMREAGIKSRGHHETPAAKGAAGNVEARGVVLQARLLTTVASSPVNAAVIASLTHGARVGGTFLPEGTQFHGEVRGGGDSARVFVDFAYVRLLDGTTLDLDAVATDRGGRQGIPGVRPVTGRTAGSVGLSGGQAMARSAANAIPGFGGVLASGAAAMADAATDKAQRLDRDEVIVQADANTLIAIYVRSARI